MKEIPQFVIPKNLVQSELSVKKLSNFMDIFKKMNKSDQEQFLKLQNRFSEDDEINRFLNTNSQISKNQERLEYLKKATNIYGIYKTNTFFNGVSDGVSIKVLFSGNKKYEYFIFHEMLKN